MVDLLVGDVIRETGNRFDSFFGRRCDKGDW
jgi:hypothetical protein